MAEYVLRLYVVGMTASGGRAIENVRELCETELGGRYELEIIDIMEHPEIAELEKIVATPLLKREVPRPIRHIIGDLTDREKILYGLDIAPLAMEKEGGSS